MVVITLILAVAAFVVGTATYFVAGVVDAVAIDLGVAVGTAGQLTTAFAIAYAAAAPFLVGLSNGVERRRLICLALLVFAVANIVAGLAPDFGTLMASRVLAALAATLITPVAVAVAAELAPPHRRGLVMAVVMGGITVAFAVGVPLGTYVSALLDWRTVFFGVAVMAVVAALAVRGFVPRVEPAARTGVVSPSVLRDPVIAMLLGMTVLMFAGAFTVFGFIGPVLSRVAGADAGQASILLMVFGAAALVGTTAGAWLSDRLGIGAVVTGMLVVFTLAHLGFSLLALVPEGTPRLYAAGVVMIFAALPGFAFMPVQQARLALRAGANTPMAIAWHASAIFVGQGLGAAIGGAVAMTGVFVLHGMVAAAIGLLLVALSLWVNRRFAQLSAAG